MEHSPNKMLITSSNQAFKLQKVNFDCGADHTLSKYLSAARQIKCYLSSPIYNHYTSLNCKQSINQSGHFSQIPENVTCLEQELQQ